MREGVHRFANAEEVHIVYAHLERPRTIKGLIESTRLSYSQVRSALKILGYLGVIVGYGPEPNRRYQWRH